nr:uncharacterized protein LOC100209752 [Hydra vulgaris]
MKGYIVLLLVNLFVEIESRGILLNKHYANRKNYFDNEYFENGPNRREMNLHANPVENKDFSKSNNIKANMENLYSVEKKTDYISKCLTANQKNCYNAVRVAGYSQEASFNTCCQ